MNESPGRLHGELSPWPSKERLASVLRDAGLKVYVGRYSVRVEDCSHFSFEDYGGDRGDPVIDADADSIEKMQTEARLVSAALTRAGIRHRFEVYDERHNLHCYLHHDWPPPSPEPRVPQDFTEGWKVPASVGARDEEIRAFPWPGRDEAFLLFNIEDFGPAGPAAGSICLLRRKASPEVIWRTTSSDVFLDEFWLGPAHSVFFSDGGEYALFHPFLWRVAYQRAAMCVVRPSDHRCALIETDFVVFRADSPEPGLIRVLPVPDPRVKTLSPEWVGRTQGHAPRTLRESDLEWFPGEQVHARSRALIQPAG